MTTTAEEAHLIQIPTELSAFPEMISLSIICRLCANQSDKLIGIYSEDGMNNDLGGKMNLYLPIKVAETDSLPLQCCWQCASTVLAWHDLVVTSVEADRRLRSYQFVTEKQLEEITTDYARSASILTAAEEETLVAAASISKQNIHFETINTAELLVEDATSDRDNANVECNILERSTANETICYNIPVDTEVDSPDPCKEEDDMLNFNNESELKEDISADINNSESDEQEDEYSLYKFECWYCPTMFVTKLDLMQHIKKDHSDESQEDLLESDAKELKVEGEDGAGKKANKSTKRSFHVRHMTKHPLPKINQEEVNKAKVEVDGRVFYICKQCGKSLHSMYTYVWHIRIHTGERPYICNLCNKQFRVSQGLVRHLKETHERIKNFECDICGRLFATKRNVEEHRRIHTNERPYVCATCGKAFKQKASLFVHNRSHSSEFPFSCTECPQKFRTRTSLLVHATKHTGEKPFACDVCGRQFRIKYELKRHKLIHSEEKPFSCSICSQAFRQKRYLRNHLKLNHSISNPTELLQEFSNAIAHKETNITPSTSQIIATSEIHFTDNPPESPSAHKPAADLSESEDIDNFRANKEVNITPSTSQIIATSEIHFTDNPPKSPSAHKPAADLSESEDIENFRANKEANITPSTSQIIATSEIHFTDNPPESPSAHKPAADLSESEDIDACKTHAASDTDTTNKNPYADFDTLMCNLCDKPFWTKIELQDHLATLHSINVPKIRRKKDEVTIRPFECSKCDRSYTKRHDLSRHLVSKHCQANTANNTRAESKEILKNCFKENNLYQCDFCAQTFQKSGNLLRHRTIHINKKLYCCSLCGKTFRLNVSLTRHISDVHHDTRKFQCDICKKFFKNKWSLDEHANTHTDLRPYICDVCGKSFRQSASLYVHKQYHLKQFPYECNVCYKTFPRKHNLKKHEAVHTGHKTHSCEVCGSLFGDKQALRRHKKCHVTVNCEKCGCEFSQRRYLKLHQKRCGQSLEGFKTNEVLEEGFENDN